MAPYPICRWTMAINHWSSALLFPCAAKLLLVIDQGATKSCGMTIHEGNQPTRIKGRGSGFEMFWTLLPCFLEFFGMSIGPEKRLFFCGTRISTPQRLNMELDIGSRQDVFDSWIPRHGSNAQTSSWARYELISKHLSNTHISVLGKLNNDLTSRPHQADDG